MPEPEKPAEEVVVEKPADGNPPVEKPAEKPADKPAENPAEKPAEKKDEKPVEKPAEGVKIELKLSEGSMLTEDDLTKISDYASKKGLSQEEATALLSEKENDRKAGFDAREAHDRKFLENENKKWIEECKSDPEIGGDKLNEAAELSKRLLDRYGSDKFKEGLEKSGLGNFPEFLRFMYRIGKNMDSDKLIIGDQVNKSPKDIASRMYAPPAEKK